MKQSSSLKAMGIAFVVVFFALLPANSQASGIIDTIVGGGPGNNVPALQVGLGNPIGVAVDSVGNRYIAAPSIQRVLKVDPGGTLTTVAGDGLFGFAGDGGPATSARLANPFGVAVDAAGNLFIADGVNRRIRRVDVSTGIITTVAGDGTFGFAGDGGAATSAHLGPVDVAVDAVGNLFIVDGSNHRIRRVDASTGTIITVAGDGTFSSCEGEGVLATNVCLRHPQA